MKNEEVGRLILLAAINGDCDLADIAIKYGAPIDGVDNEETPLCCAIANGHEGIVQRLVAAGADLNINDSVTSRTPLTTAVAHGESTSHIVKFLLKHGADPEMKNEMGETPLGIACAVGNSGNVESLLAAGAKVDRKHSDGLGPRPLEIARIKGHSHIVDILQNVGTLRGSGSNGIT